MKITQSEDLSLHSVYCIFINMYMMNTGQEIQFVCYRHWEKPLYFRIKNLLIKIKKDNHVPKSIELTQKYKFPHGVVVRDGLEFLI